MEENFGERRDLFLTGSLTEIAEGKKSIRDPRNAIEFLKWRIFEYYLGNKMNESVAENRNQWIKAYSEKSVNKALYHTAMFQRCDSPRYSISKIYMTTPIQSYCLTFKRSKEIF